MSGRGGRHAAIDGYANAAAVAHGPASVLFRVSRLSSGDVALKVFRFGGTLEDQAHARTWMLRDWRIWSELAHPHVLAASDYGETNNALFVATPWLGGPSLRAVLDQRRTLDPAQIGRLARQLAGALDAAAAVRLVHLDVKPENVLFSAADGLEHAYVRDFGAGSLAAWKVGADRSRTFRGTLEYAAPEQINSGAVDGRTAVYSLGCLLYETLTGATPYAGRSRAALVRAHQEERPPPVGDGPADVDRVFATALAKSRGERYATCTALAEALCAALELASAPRPALAAGRRPVVRVRHAAVAAAVAVVAAGGVAAASWLPIGAPDPAQAPDEAMSSRDFVAALEAAGPTVKGARKSVRSAPTAKPVARQKAGARKHKPAPHAATDAAAKPERRHVVRKPRTPEESGASPKPTSGSSATASPPVARPASSSGVPRDSAGGAGSRPGTTTQAAAPRPAAPPLPPPPPPPDAPPPPPPPPPP